MTKPRMNGARMLVHAALALAISLTALPSPAAAGPVDVDVLEPLRDGGSGGPQTLEVTTETVRVVYPPDGGIPVVDRVFAGAGAAGFSVLASDFPIAEGAAKVALLADGQVLQEAEIISPVVLFENVPLVPSNEYGLRILSTDGAILHDALGLRFWTEDATEAARGLLETLGVTDPTAASASSCRHVSNAVNTIYTGGSYNVGNGDFSTTYRDLIGGSWKSNWNYGSNCHSTRYDADYYMGFGIRGLNQMNGPGYYAYEYAVNERGTTGPGSMNYFSHGHTIVVMKPRAFMVTPTGVTASVVDADAEGRPAQSCTSTFILKAPLVFVKSIWAGLAGLVIPDYVCTTNWSTITTAASGAGGRGNEFSLNTNGDHLSGTGWITIRYDTRGEFSMKAEGDFYIDARMGGSWDTATNTGYLCGSPCDTVSQYWEYWQLSRQAKVV